MNRVKIVLDADVIFHFSKGGLLNILPQIFNNYDYIVLSYVYDEIKGDHKIKLDNQIHLLKNISLVEFKPTGEMMREYAQIFKQTRGRGESACLAYCRFNRDVVGSSNLKDVCSYCCEHGITYLTTFDFLYHAIQKGLLSREEALEFIKSVVKSGSLLPSEEDFLKFVSKVQL